MNVFDVGGIVSLIATIISAIIGTALFKLLNKLFEIAYLGGFKAVIAEWFSCFFVGAFIVNLAFGLISGVVSVLWFLIKIALIIAVVGGAGYFIYTKFKERKNLSDGSKEEETSKETK
ncbi:MAG: hypothetical protein ACI33J_11375 [Clostridium sp.]